MTASSVYWVNILERDGWLLVNVDGRKIGIIISITEAGKEYLRIAGFNLGESALIGDRKNVLSVKVERVPPDKQEEMLPKIQEGLPEELRGLPLAFL